MIPKSTASVYETHIVVFSPFYPPSIGGLQNHAQEFNRHLSNRGYRITLITPHLPSASPAYEQELPAVTIIRVPAFELITNWPIPKVWRKEFWSAWRQISRDSPAAVIGRTRFFTTTWLARLFAWQQRIPYIHIEHGSDYVQLRNPLWQRLAYALDHTLGRFTIQTAAKVIANSAHTAAFIQRLVPKVKPTIIYRGIERQALDNIAPALRETTPRSGTRILYLGRLIASKGVSDLLVSVSRLTHPSLEVVIAGHGPDSQHLKKLAEELGINHFVRFKRPASWTDAIALLKSCDIVVNPSYTEGLPTTVIEAALCQKAIIATDVGGTSEIIQHNQSGLLVPPRDPAALTRALTTLITDSALRHRLGENANRAARGKFEWRQAMAAYHQLLQQLL